MVKIFYSLSAFIICVIFGNLFTHKHKKDNEILLYFYNFNKKLIINLQYEKENLVNFIKQYDKNNEILKCFLKQIKNNKINLTVIKNKKIKEMLNSYFLNLGKTDTNSQIEYLKSYNKIFESTLQEYKKENEKKIVLYPKLGFFGGLILFILLI